MMENLFDLESAECEEIRKSIDEAVNTAIEHAMQAGMRTAAVSVKIDVHLNSEEQESGRVMIVPGYSYKAGIKIGGTYEAGKGKTRSRIGMWRDPEGYWHTQYADQQLSMVGGA